VTSNQRSIPCTCSVHGGTLGYPNLAVRRTGGGEIVLDLHQVGACVITLDEAAANQLFDVLGEWLG
jgi:lipoate-protein ligase A